MRLLIWRVICYPSAAGLLGWRMVGYHRWARYAPWVDGTDEVGGVPPTIPESHGWANRWRGATTQITSLSAVAAVCSTQRLLVPWLVMIYNNSEAARKSDSKLYSLTIITVLAYPLYINYPVRSLTIKVTGTSCVSMMTRWQSSIGQATSTLSSNRPSLDNVAPPNWWWVIPDWQFHQFHFTDWHSTCIIKLAFG